MKNKIPGQRKIVPYDTEMTPDYLKNMPDHVYMSPYHSKIIPLRLPGKN